MKYKCISFIYHRQFIILAIDSAVKQREVSLCHYFVHGITAIWLLGAF
jgi:hypothetical protein